MICILVLFLLVLAAANVSVTSDSSFVADSENPVQSKVIKAALDSKMDMVSGSAGNILGFDANGDLIAGDPKSDFDIKTIVIPPGVDRNIFGFEIDANESNPASMITYIGANAEYTPAVLGSAIFDYGSWANAWFIHDIKVAIIDQNGIILEELDKNDYTKKIDGTASSITNPSNNGNVMVGIPTVWVKCDNTNAARPKYYFAAYQADEDYHAYAHTNEDGDVVPYIWIGAYEASFDGTRMRSVSGVMANDGCGTSKTYGYYIEQTIANNNPSGKHYWNISVLCDRQLINLLLILISKSTNTQLTFGRGYVRTGSDVQNNLTTGTMNVNGLFWGKASDYNNGVKVFGIENYWADIGEITLGLISAGSTSDTQVLKAKLTYGTQDGSTTTGYNETGSGYIETTHGWSGEFIRLMSATQYGLFPNNNHSGTQASMSTYYCDYVNYGSNNWAAVFGGDRTMGTYGYHGAFCCYCNCDLTMSWNKFTGYRLSMKPPLSSFNN